MKFKPLDDRIIVHPIVQDSITPGGIHIPETAKERPQKGTILSVGPKVEDESIVEGITVLFGQYVGMETKMDGDTIVILREGDVLAIIE